VSELTPVPGATATYDDDGREVVVVMTCGSCGRSWNDAAVSAITPTPSGRCPFEYEHEGGRPTDERARALAREQYGCDEIEIDTDAVVSRDHHTHGAFVAAWVWVTFTDEPEGT
jgi:hypothetical protein